MKKLDLKLQDEGYDVRIETGLLERVGQELSAWYKGKNIAIVTDSTVDALYGEQLVKVISKHDYTVSKIIVAPGEQSKTLSTLDYVYSRLADSGMTRSSLLIAFGGGVVGDLTGFAAATYMRGIPYVQIPTTVMSQLDSSIGGKTAVNTAAGKNLAGCFYQPKAVYIDPKLLETLSDKVFADGIAEAVKYGAIKDAHLFRMIQGMNSIKEARLNIEDIVYRCASIKCQIVSQDQFDHGERMVLNFGHTIGHGIEKYFDYSTYTHGEAVSLGMLMITRNSEAMGLTEKGTYASIEQLLSNFNLPTSTDNIDKDRLLDFISHDKKSAETYINLIILKEIGAAYIHKTTKEELVNFIK